MSTDNTPGTKVDVKPRSRDVTDGMQKAPARAMLRAIGMTDDDWVKPQVGIASAWNEVTPCNMTLRKLADHVRQAHEDAQQVQITSRKISQRFAQIESVELEELPAPLLKVVDGAAIK